MSDENLAALIDDREMRFRILEFVVRQHSSMPIVRQIARCDAYAAFVLRNEVAHTMTVVIDDEGNLTGFNAAGEGTPAPVQPAAE